MIKCNGPCANPSVTVKPCETLPIMKHNGSEEAAKPDTSAELKVYNQEKSEMLATRHPIIKRHVINNY